MNTEMTTRETELLAENAALELEVVRLRNTLKGAEYTLKGFSTDFWSDELLRNVQAALSTPFNPQALEALINKASEMMRQRAISAGSAINPIYGAGDAIDEIRALPVGRSIWRKYCENKPE